MRLRAFAFPACLAAAVVGGASVAAKEPLALVPSSKWSVNYAEDFCRLSRTFGTGREQVGLVLDRFSPGDSFRLILVGDTMRDVSPGIKARVRFGDGFAEQELDFYSGKVGTHRAWIFQSSLYIRPRSDAETAAIEQDIKANGVADARKLAPITEADEASVTEVSIGRPLRNPVILKTGSMRSAFAALRTCTDELLTHWGIDVARHKEIATFAKPLTSPGTWIKSGDYPEAMLRSRQPGLVQFRLTIGEDGTPTDCRIQQSTHSAGFDKAVCDALKRRARFEPARDTEGRPLTSFYLNSVHFQISY